MDRQPHSHDFEEQVRPHLDSMFRTALRIVRHRAVAEDIVQEACLRAFAASERGAPGNSFRAWIFRILVNLCIDHIRANNRHGTPVPVASDDGDDVKSESPDPERLTASRRMGERIVSAVAALPIDLRLVVLLILVEEMSYSEAAKSLGIPVGTVRSRLSRARAELQALLGEDAPPETSPVRSLRIVKGTLK